MVNRKRVQRLMRLMGLVGLQPRRSTRRPPPAHAKYPYLLRGVDVVRANQVWAADITYIPMGSQFTADEFIAVVEHSGAKISMDGKGCWRDNVYVERLWRSVKYEEVYLHAYDSVPEARSGIADYFAFFNDERPHQALNYSVPSAFYFSSLAASVKTAA